MNHIQRILCCALIMTVGASRVQAGAKDELTKRVTTEFHNKPITLQGELFIINSSKEYRVRLAGSDATYILELADNQRQWADNYIGKQLKIEGTYQDGGLILPAAMNVQPVDVPMGTQDATMVASDELGDATEQQMVAECNRYRMTHGLQPLRPLRDLMASARQHTWNMRHSYGFRHGGTSGWMAENIAMGQPDPTTVTNMWYNSSGHRANMLNPSYNYIGVANYDNLWTQQFR